MDDRKCKAANTGRNYLAFQLKITILRGLVLMRQASKDYLSTESKQHAKAYGMHSKFRQKTAL